MTVVKFSTEIKTSLKMANNLENMIRRSGLLNKEVAERKGIRPETVSRHISGALQFTLKDAEEYAMILDCSPQQVMFAQHAIPLFGSLNDEIVTVRPNTKKQKAYYVAWPVEESRRLIVAKHTNPNKSWANGRFYSFDKTCIDKVIVDPKCFMTVSLVLIKGEENPQFAVVYPEPGGTFSLAFNSDTHSTTDQSRVSLLEPDNKRSGLDLVWGTPILSCWFQPELLGIVKKQF